MEDSMEELTATNDAGIKDRDRAETRRDPIRHSPFAIRPIELSPHAERIVAIARSWIGTPYVHQASLRGAGCDCLGLIRGIWRELKGYEPEDVPPYSLDWAEATGAETLYMALSRHAR